MRSNFKKPKIARLNGVKSWTTMLVGMVMLLVGLVAGYVGRPIIESRTNPNSDQAGQASASLNDLVISNTRHFIGNPDAPVTIIEFSDFQ